MKLLKRIARALLGSFYDRMQRRWSAWRDRRRRRQADRRWRKARDFVVTRTDLRVAAGPFAGMRYVSQAAEGNLLPKLVGSYEVELAPAIESVVARGCDRVIDIGSADGYYAVGLALRLPEATVFAIDIDAVARSTTREMAVMNGVTDRVRIASTLESSMVQGARILIVCDCEGCERELLDPQRIPELRQADIVVELHEFIDSSIAEVMTKRFQETHDIELIEAESRRPRSFPVLKGLSRDAQAVAVDEMRPPGMRWAWMRSRFAVF